MRSRTPRPAVAPLALLALLTAAACGGDGPTGVPLPPLGGLAGTWDVRFVRANPSVAGFADCFPESGPGCSRDTFSLVTGTGTIQVGAQAIPAGVQRDGGTVAAAVSLPTARFLNWQNIACGGRAPSCWRVPAAEQLRLAGCTPEPFRADAAEPPSLSLCLRYEAAVAGSVAAELTVSPAAEATFELPAEGVPAVLYDSGGTGVIELRRRPQ